MIRLIDYARPFAALIDPEEAHRLAVNALKVLPSLAIGRDDPILGLSVFGLDFPNPLGLAAGFDKNAEVADAILRLGFGFTEVGTLTPRPQRGNPRPRLFRLARDEALPPLECQVELVLSLASPQATANTQAPPRSATKPSRPNFPASLERMT